MQLAIRVAVGSILIAAAGIPAFAQKRTEPTQKPTKIIARETIVLCTVLPNGDVDDETPQNICELSFNDGGGAGGDSTTSTCSNDSSESRSNCYPTNGPVGLGTGPAGGAGTRGTPIVSCQQLYQQAKASCRGETSCLSAALSAEEDCLRRSGTLPTAHRLPGSTGGQKPTRTLMVTKVPSTINKKQRCDKLQSNNTQYCNTTVHHSMPSLYGTCVAATKESYDTCMLP